MDFFTQQICISAYCAPQTVLTVGTGAGMVTPQANPPPVQVVTHVGAQQGQEVMMCYAGGQWEV